MNIPQSVLEPFGFTGFPKLTKIPLVSRHTDYIADQLDRYAKVLRREYHLSERTADLLALRFENFAFSCGAEDVAVVPVPQYKPHMVLYLVYILYNRKWKKTKILMPSYANK